MNFVYVLVLFTTAARADSPRAPAGAFLPARPHSAPAVDLQKTLMHVDSRAKDWVDEHKCLSCHTVLPYAFSRRSYADRSAQAAIQATRDYIASRADNFANTRPWYPSRPDSHDTEAVLSALMIGAAEGSAASSPLAKVVYQNMTALQKADGSWAWLDENLMPFETARAKLFGNAIAALAYAKAGPEIRNTLGTAAALEKLKGYLRQQAQRADLNLFDKASLLWVDSAFPDLLPAATAKSFTRQLVQIQDAVGGFSTNSMGDWRKQTPGLTDGPDCFATAYILTALKGNKALQGDAGFQAAWDNGLDWLASQQQPDGQFLGASLNSSSSYNGELISDFTNNLSAGLLASEEGEN